jgi:ribose transport system substrate-binding protein
LRAATLLFATFGILALGLAACGGDDEAAEPAAPAPAEPAEPAPAEPSAPAEPAAEPPASDEAAAARDKVQAKLETLLALEGSPDVRSQWPEIVESSCYPAKTKAEGPLKVGYAYAGRSNTWQVQNGDGGVWFLENHPDVGEVIAADGEENPDKQISDIQSLIAQQVDLLVLNPATTAVSPAVQQACDAGIPVVVYDRFVEPGTGVTASMYADEVQDGYNCGKSIVDALGGTGDVVILGGIPGIGVTEDRMEGARQAFAEAPGINVLAEGYSDYDPAKGRQIMEEWLQKYDKIDAVWSDSGIQAIGAVDALEEAGRLGEVKMVAGGQFNHYLRYWSEKGFTGCGSTIASDVGLLAAQLGIDIVRGKYLPTANIPAPLIVISQDTIADYFRPDLPDSYWATEFLPDSLLLEIYAEQ